MPIAIPDTTMARELALRAGGARSPTRGSMSCGVTVVTPQRKDTTWKATNDVVRQRTSHLSIISRRKPIRVEVCMIGQAYQSGGKRNKAKDERPATEEVPQGTDEQ